MLNIEEIRDYALSLPFTTADFPFDEVTMTIRVKGKIFLFLPLDRFPASFSFKIEPERNAELQDTHEYILPAFHLNKQHWASFDLSNSLSNNSTQNYDPAFALSLIYNSYVLVASKLKSAEKKEVFELLEKLGK